MLVRGQAPSAGLRLAAPQRLLPGSGPFRLAAHAAIPKDAFPRAHVRDLGPQNGLIDALETLAGLCLASSLDDSEKVDCEQRARRSEPLLTESRNGKATASFVVTVSQTSSGCTILTRAGP